MTILKRHFCRSSSLLCCSEPHHRRSLFPFPHSYKVSIPTPSLHKNLQQPSISYMYHRQGFAKMKSSLVALLAAAATAQAAFVPPWIYRSTRPKPTTEAVVPISKTIVEGVPHLATAADCPAAPPTTTTAGGGSTTTTPPPVASLSRTRPPLSWKPRSSALGYPIYSKHFGMLPGAPEPSQRGVPADADADVEGR